MSTLEDFRDSDITTWLRDEGARDPDFTSKLFVSHYRLLRAIATSHSCGRWTSETQSATTVVHECYLHLRRTHRLSFETPQAFLGFAAKVMVRIRIDYSRQIHAAKRGGSRSSIPLELLEDCEHPLLSSADAERVADALEALERIDRRRANVARLKGFCGFDFNEISQQLQISATTAKRDWKVAKCWLARCLTSLDHDQSGAGDWEAAEEDPIQPSSQSPRRL